MLVSVISVFYNREKFVDFSVTSLIKQSYQNLEIVLCDDGSSDDTLSELKKFEASDPRVRVLHHANSGFTNSIRRAVDASNGELVAIHGSGDLSHPERIQKQVEFLAQNPSVGVVGCLFEREDLILRRKEVVGRQKGGDVLNNICVSHGEVMFRREIYDAVGGYRPFFHFSQDRDLWLRMSLLSKIDFIPEVLYTAYTRSDGVTGSAYNRAIQLYFAEISKQMYEMRLRNGWDFIDKFGSNAWVFKRRSKRLGKELIKHALWAFRQGKATESFKIIEMAKGESNSAFIQFLAFLILFLGKFDQGPAYLSRILNLKRRFIK
ncbi:glycosyltransferase family 2 protein [Cyclobacterium xiamenense]|jgi:glycosyltransferase involved in cell wall biosynthesis|uniref:glycosyltransferase family 2 protein n=1 Tax=Cyclobacterium xiamenense TaxID=1297121 RepID=UPI0035D080BD